jgi:probable rRNA maturation factor
MSKVSFINNTDNKLLELNDLKKLINYAINFEKLENVEFSIVFVSNKKIQELNKKYRQIDKPTDVLSFAFEDTKTIPNLKVRMLGEIYISLEQAYKQSKQLGHSYLRELSFLLIHGFLHLLGYNHLNKIEEEKMIKRQEAILNGYEIRKEKEK